MAECISGEQSRRSSNRRWLPTSTWERLESGSCGDREPVGQGALDDGAADRMFGPFLERCRRGKDLSRWHAIHANHVSNAQLPCRQRAGLVEGHAPYRRKLFEPGASLDQDPLARRSCERRHDRDRRRDHERARAGDHQQNQRTIDPRAPCPAEHRRNDSNTCGEDEHGRRVQPCEPIDEGLTRSALRLCAFHEMNDACDRGVAAQPRHFDFERVPAVYCSSKHIVAWRLLDRERLARHRRLIDVARSGGHPAVERDFLAGPDDDDIAEADVVDGQYALHTTSSDECGLRREVHERPNRSPRALHRPGFEKLCEREQENNRGSFGPLPERHRAGDSDQHEHVNVEGAPANRHPRPFCRMDAAGDDGERER